MKETYTKGESISQIQKFLAETLGRNQVVHTLIGDLSASDNKRIFVAPSKCYVRAVYLITETGDAIDGTDYWVLDVYNVTDSESLASAPANNLTGGVAITADTPYDLLVDQNNQLDALDVLEIQAVKHASATTQAECSVLVVFGYDEDDEA